MANSVITDGLGPPGSIAELLLDGLNPSQVAEMVATVLSGQGSVGQLSGQGSSGLAVSTIASGTITAESNGPFFATITDSTATFETDGVTPATDTLYIEGVEITATWSVSSETTLLSAVGGFGGPDVGDSYRIDRITIVGVSGTGSDGSVTGSGGV